MLAKLRRIKQTIFPGATWQHPLLAKLIPLIDPLDGLICRIRGYRDIPPYSIRIRSNGITGQFGGSLFVQSGQEVLGLLRRGTGLAPSSQSLEIGCGCGRNAIALASYLDDAHYTGLDIEATSLAHSRRNALLQRKLFRFELMDIQNNEYNPSGTFGAEDFQFPYEDESFDVIFLISVFTHMRPEAVVNYLNECGRMLKSGGRCLVTGFLMDYGRTFARMSFPYQLGACYYQYQQLPEIAVGYYSAFLIETAMLAGLELVGKPMIGVWRGNNNVPANTRFGQDVLVFKKRPSI